MKLAAILLLALASGASIATAQSPGTFTATGSMTTPRAVHTATLLPSGKVLITGGSGSAAISGTLASAELFDPSTGVFTPTGGMNTPRAGHKAILLANGKVLITGGSGDASAELYDPSIATFTPTGRMTTTRGALLSATLLRDGRVLIAGGGQSTAELYDPSTGTFAATGSMRNPLADAETGTPLPDGTVLVGTEVYDPTTGTFTDTGGAGHDFGYTATLLIGGKAFIAGGGDSDPESCLPQTDLYDPATVTFTPAPRMTLCRFSHTATLLPNGTVLIAGGASYDAGPYQANLASVEIYDFSTGTFGWIGNMIAGRQVHTATLLPDGRVLIAGGVGAPGYSALSAAEVYTPPALVPAPALFSLSGDGKGQGAIWDAQTGLIASSQTLAAAGEILSMYSTGLIEGAVIPPQVAVGGALAEILYFGDAPGYPGYNQVNFRMPDGVAPGSAVSVRLTYIGRPSNGVTIGVQ